MTLDSPNNAQVSRVGLSRIVYVSIGNSDDKLTQLEWSCFVDEVDDACRVHGNVHGSWFSLPGGPWQNACWCVAVELARERSLKGRLKHFAGQYEQDSIAYAVVTHTEFLAPRRG